VPSYDEERELNLYVYSNYRYLMRPIEIRASIVAELGSAQSNVVAIAAKRYGGPEVDLLLTEGYEEFQTRVRVRLLTEHADEIVLNRCTKCDRLVRTPLAKQCFWCGHDWHKEAKARAFLRRSAKT
jgi:hypothetical protein